MTDFQDLSGDIVQARSNAATFHKVDLHVHSWESPDFPKVGDKQNCVAELTEEDRDAQAPDIIAAAKKLEDLRLIAITDHNHSRAAAEISRLSDRNLTVLPGMEVALQATIFPDSRVHVLVILPEGSSSEDIQQVFSPDCGMPKYDSRTRESVARTPIDEFINEVHSLGGLCIAGHVNSSEGIRTLFRAGNVQLLRAEMRRKELERREEEGKLGRQEETQLKKLAAQIKELEDDTQKRYLEFLSSHKFDAVEVQRSTDDQFYRGVHTDELGVRAIPCLLGSDAHNLHDIGLSGSTTYIKMTTPGLRDLRRALLDPGARIRYEDTIQRPRIARILGIRFNGGFFQEHTIGFSDNLTCLIGGRGTGKSAAIEGLRYVFEHELDHLPKDKRDDINGRREHTLTGTLMEVLFVDESGDHMVLRRQYDRPRTKCCDVDGTERDEIDVSVSSHLDVRVYGWGEIEDVARSKRGQLRLIDGFVPEAKERIHEVENCIQKLESNTRQIVELAAEVQQLLPRIAELPAIEAALERLSTKELNAIFAGFDRNESAVSAVQVFSSAVSALKARFIDEDGNAYNLVDDMEQLLATVLPDLEAYGWKEELQTAVEAQAGTLQNRYQALLEQFDALEDMIEDRTKLLEAERRRIEVELAKQAGEAKEEDIQSLIARRRSLTEEVSDLRAVYKQIKDKQTRIDELMGKRRMEVVPDLQSKRRRLTRVRRTKINAINQRLKQLGTMGIVSIDLRHQKEREPFRIALGAPDARAPAGVLKHVDRWYKSHDYAGLYTRRHSPHTFVRAVLNEHLPALCVRHADKDGVVHEITRERAEGVAEHLSPRLERDEPYYEAAKLEQLLELEHLDTEDLPIICLNNEPIEDLSPGQRCTALIPIILLESNCPLIIDQPEDNMDNKLVFALVVDILRGLKEQRQIIVATHNPNIAVSGDAEQVIVFEAYSGKCCEIPYQGSIDDEQVVDQIKAIMEGSEEAFRMRAEKYGYRLDFIG